MKKFKVTLRQQSHESEILIDGVKCDNAVSFRFEQDANGAPFVYLKLYCNEIEIEADVDEENITQE